jgi:hypothetical protein
MKHGNVFGSETKSYDAKSMPLWIEVKEKKLGGGTISLADYTKGDLIPAAVPVYLPKMGGDAVIIDAFEVDGAVASDATAIKLKDGIFGTKPKKDMIVGKVASTGVAAKAAALGTFVEGTGFTITANSLGTLSDGDFVYIVSVAGSSKPAVKPNGLTLREIYVDATVDVAHSIVPTATVAVVTKGQILADRMPAALADWQEDALKGNITFEHEL